MEGYLGLSSYWHRNFFIGHSLNIKQVIESQYDFQIEFPKKIDGIELQIFQDLTSFIEQKQQSISVQLEFMIRFLKLVRELFQDTSTSILSFDIVEYSPICDWQNLTIDGFINKFQIFNSIITSIKE